MASLSDTAPTSSAAAPVCAYLLKIAPKIRNYIYELIFECEMPILLLGANCPDQQSSMRASHPIDGISLLLTSQQIRKEVLISAPREQCNDDYHLFQFGFWKDSLLPSTRQLLRNIIIDVSPICQPDCSRATSSGLELGSLLDLKWGELGAHLAIHHEHPRR
jgi:hypothetical protein